jgi:hypothetical protein
VLGEALSSAQIAGFAITITAIATGVTLGNARTASTMPRLVRGRRRWRSLEGIPARVGVDCP